MSPHETTDTRQTPSDGAESPPQPSSGSEDAQTPTDAADGRTEPTEASAFLSATSRVLLELRSERARQDEKWGEQNHPDGTLRRRARNAGAARARCDLRAAEGAITWRHILDEEVQEAFAETDPARLREELIQVAAVAVNWIEAIDRRPTPEPAA